MVTAKIEALNNLTEMSAGLLGEELRKQIEEQKELWIASLANYSSNTSSELGLMSSQMEVLISNISVFAQVSTI